MNPVLVNAWRGDSIESRHHGTAIIVNSIGETLFSAGDVDTPVFPRSSIKLIQALPWIESGAADAFRFTDQHIALSCASHSGESIHTDLVHEMLSTIGLNTKHLACGPQLPQHEDTAHALLRAGDGPGREHHNCSGKHSAMLAHCRHQGWSSEGYHHYDHPVQQNWRQVLGELCDCDADSLIRGIDGCGIPTLAFPLRHLAMGYARFAAARTDGDKREQAMVRIREAIIRHPVNIAGSDRACSQIVSASKGRVIVKTGAEGVYIGMIPVREIAFALKIDDGATRASETAICGLLKWLNEPLFGDPALDGVFRRPIRNSLNDVVGRVSINPDVFQRH